MAGGEQWKKRAGKIGLAILETLGTGGANLLTKPGRKTLSTADPVSGTYAIAPRLAVDADGYCWRVFDPDGVGIEEEMWSMCPVNPDNEPIPQPVIYYVPMPDGAEDSNEYSPAFQAEYRRLWLAASAEIDHLKDRIAALGRER